MAIADDLSTAPVPAADLLADIDVVPVAGAEHRFELDIPADWNVFYTFGGVTMAAALRSAERSIDRADLVPLTAHAVYCAPIQAGLVEIDVDVLRNGRTAAQASVDLRQAGHDGVDLRLLTTVGQRIDSPLVHHGLEFPDDVLPPDAVTGRPSIDEIAMDEDNPFASINYHQQTVPRRQRPARPRPALRRAGSAARRDARSRVLPPLPRQRLRLSRRAVGGGSSRRGERPTTPCTCCRATPPAPRASCWWRCSTEPASRTRST